VHERPARRHACIGGDRNTVVRGTIDRDTIDRDTIDRDTIDRDTIDRDVFVAVDRDVHQRRRGHDHLVDRE
jgi:hypothetical protein